MLGRTFVNIEGCDQYSDEILFTSANGDVFKFHHDTECCEQVLVEEIIGDIQDLIGAPMLMAEESSDEGHRGEVNGTWTFYKFATTKGYVTVRWFGWSGSRYYSEHVNLELIEAKR
jgi:hypothetical protein